MKTVNEKDIKITKELFDFIEKSPTAFHAVEQMKNRLDKEGYQQLLEGKKWELQSKEKYYVIRNGSAIIAFRIPETKPQGFQIMASHSDSPTFRIKENPEMKVEQAYVKLNVEKYGGMLCAPWFDRPLSVAGRVIIKEGNRLESKLVSIDRDLLMIPNLAIHMNRDANNNYQYNVQKDMLPLFSMSGEEGEFAQMIADEAGVEKEQIIGNDLYLYNRQNGSIWGQTRNFYQLDDWMTCSAHLLH